MRLARRTCIDLRHLFPHFSNNSVYKLCKMIDRSRFKYDWATVETYLQLNCYWRTTQSQLLVLKKNKRDLVLISHTLT